VSVPRDRMDEPPPGFVPMATATATAPASGAGPPGWTARRSRARAARWLPGGAVARYGTDGTGSADWTRAAKAAKSAAARSGRSQWGQWPVPS
jgi:hypothetical protein